MKQNQTVFSILTIYVRKYTIEEISINVQNVLFVVCLLDYGIHVAGRRQLTHKSSLGVTGWQQGRHSVSHVFANIVIVTKIIVSGV